MIWPPPWRRPAVRDCSKKSGSSVAAYRFTHDLIRETVFASLSKARQALLHRAVADTLEQLPLPEQTRHLAALADHLMKAGEPGRALPYVLLAGDQAEAVYAHSEAERHFRLAARLAADLGDRAREAEALEKLAAPSTCWAATAKPPMDGRERCATISNSRPTR